MVLIFICGIFMESSTWLVILVMGSLVGESVMDPIMGSVMGSTLVIALIKCLKGLMCLELLGRLKF